MTTATILLALGAVWASFVGTRLLIALMRSAGAGQPIRDYGPKIHEHKRGTPTMGGLVVLLVFLVALPLAQGGLGAFGAESLLLMGAALGFGLVGLADDLLKFLRGNAGGLAARFKLLLQGLIALGLLAGLKASGVLGPAPALRVPFTGGAWELPWGAFAALAVLVFWGTVNAWNLTDGLDGLAGGVTLLVLAAYGVIALRGGDEGLLGAVLILGAALLGFLWWNVHPARVFLGDTGSMALGAFVAMLGLLTGTALFLPLFAVVPVLEALSVIVQVASFKLFGRRVFKVAPLHHHFERAEGVDYEYRLPSVELPEWAITLLFWGLTALGALAGLLAYGG